MEGGKRSLFDDPKPESQVVGTINQERMFISGDLTSYSLPDEFLKEKKELPVFWKGFFFCTFCGLLFVFLLFILGMTIDESKFEDENHEIIFESDGIETNVSYELNPLYDLDDCWDVDIDTRWNRNYGYSIGKSCGYDYDENPKPAIDRRYPIKLYQYDFEIGVLDFEAPYVEINLPFEIENNSNVTFNSEFWDRDLRDYINLETSFMINETNKNRTFQVNLPENYVANDINIYLEIRDNNSEELLMYEYIGKQNNCWYYGSKCTFTISKETEIGFVDLNSGLIVISLDEPLPKGVVLEINYDDDYDDSEDLLVLSLWIPPLVFSIGIILMIINKNYGMLGGSFAALLPVIIGTSILSVIVMELFL